MKQTMKKTLRALGFFTLVFCLVMSLGVTASAADGNVAKVGNTEYATIDEAIANWTNGSTLTLLADVTLSDVIKLNSNEYHILDLGTYTMTAAKNKDAIQYVVKGRSSAGYALDIKADATNPGGINASGNAIVSHIKPSSGAPSKDRPITRFYGGVFNAFYVVKQGALNFLGRVTSGYTGSNAPYFDFYGGEFNGTIYTNRSTNRFYGGTFNGSLQMSVDTSSYALVSGGRFKQFSNSMSSNLDEKIANGKDYYKFTIGSGKGVCNYGVYVDAEGYYVITSTPITELSDKYPAVFKTTYGGDDYFYYSTAATYGLFYEDADMAIEKHGAGKVTVYEKPAVTIPENVTGDAAVVEEIKSNTALKDYTPENLPADAELEIELVSVADDAIVYNVAPMAYGAEVEPTEEITFRLPVPASVTEEYAKITVAPAVRGAENLGCYEIKGEGNAKYVELSSATFGTFTIDPATVVAKIGEQVYESLADAIKAATAGDTITFVADINENVTISKNLTIDGAEKNYTGTMTINNVTATIENVNFVKGQVYKNKNTGSTAKITIKNCAFDGQGLNDYAINLGGTNSILIDTVTAKDYGFGLLQVPSACADLTVKNVTVRDCYYGLKVDHANKVTIEDVKIDTYIHDDDGNKTNEGYGIYDSNHGSKTYTIKDSIIGSIKIWERNTTNYTTFKFEGVNEVGTLSTSAYAKYEGVQVGTKIYGTLAEAWAAAQDDDTIKLLGDIKTSEAITNTKKVTLDLNGKTITGTDNATGSFGLITNKGELTITGNGTITLEATNDRDWNAYSSVISNSVGGKLTVENGTIEHLGGTDMAYGIDNLTNGKGTYAETVIEGGTIKSTYRAIRQFLNGVEAQNILTVNGGTIEGANKSIWVQDPSAKNNTGKITVGAKAVLNGDIYLYATTGSAEWPVEVSIAASAVKGEILTGNLPAGYILEKVSGNWGVNKYTVKVSNGTTTKYYNDLQKALNNTPKYYTVTLFEDYTGADLLVGKNNKAATDGITIDLDGYELKSGIKVESPSAKFTLTLKNGTVTGKIETTDNLTLTGVTVDGDIDVKGGTCTIKADAAVTGAINVVDDGVLKITDGAMINGTPFAVAEAKNVGIEAAAYVLNYQSKAVFGYYGNLDTAVAATAKSYTLVLMKDIEVENVIEPVASITLNLNGHKLYGTIAAGESLILNTKGLTITGNGAIEATFDGNVDNGKAVNAIANKSTLTVNNGNITLVGTGAQQIGYAIDNYSGASLTVKGGKITATDSNWFDAIRLFCGSKEIKVTVQGGEISSIWAQNPSANKASEVFGTVVVKGGTVGTIYYENYTTVQVLKTLSVNVVAYGAGAENASVKTNAAGYKVYAW